MSFGTRSSSASSRPIGCTPRSRRPVMLEIEIANRSGVDVDEAAVRELVGVVLAREGVDSGEIGIAFVHPEEMRELKAEHLGVDEATDVLSFPIDARTELPPGLPRQLGDAV